GVDRLGRRDIDLLRGTPGVQVALILSPEHGLRGAEDHPGLPDTVDSASGLPIYSLYGGTPLPAIAALDSVDLVLVDLQDIGARVRPCDVHDDTGLPWVRPSPNMPNLESAVHYAGSCLFEATNLSVGRGTTMPFQVVGAPWLDTGAVLPRLRGGGRWAQEGLTGVEVSGVTFTPRAPTDGKYDGLTIYGIRLRVVERRRYDPTR